MERTSGTLCIAAHSHSSLKTNELQFEKGDVLTLIDQPSGEYCQAASADGSVGVVQMSSILERPRVMLQPMPWYHGPITRFEAEKILDRNQDGQFLMRTSQSTEGIYALAVSHKGAVNHYLIAMDFSTRKLTISGKKYFSNLLELVNYYMKNEEDLGTCLTVPRIRRGALEYYVDTETLKLKWGLTESQLSLGVSIGKGEFGEVLTGTYRGMQVAVKNIHEEKRSGVAVTALLREAAVMTHMHHKNLVQLVGLVFKGASLKYIVMEVMGKGSLLKYLISRGRSVISKNELLGFCRGVCAGMSYISAMRFVHRDLAARNVLLNSNGQAKISDFGMAQRIDIHVPHEGGKFPIKWTAPEALKDSKFSSKSDVWSFGVFLWEMFSYGRVPYPSIPVDDVLEQIEDGYVMDPPDSCPQGIYEIMKICWHMEPKERPSFTALEEQLAKNFGESITSHPSPVPLRKAITLEQINELLESSAAETAYREAPLSRKTNMFLSNLTFLGPLGSGKTSLKRSILGKSFRLTEPHTLSMEFSESYFSLLNHLDWTLTSTALVYEEELVRIIVDDLLKYRKSLSSRGQRGGGGAGGGGGGFAGDFFSRSEIVMGGDIPPPLPPLPINRRRSQSFTDKFRTPDFDAIRATQRLSGSFEVLESPTHEGVLQLGYRRSEFDIEGGKVREGGHRHDSGSGDHHGSRRGFMSRLFTVKGKGGKSGLRRHNSDSARSAHLVHNRMTPPPPPPPTTTLTNGPHSSTPPPPSTKVSPIPELLLEKIRTGMRECTDSSVPVQFFSRFIDLPGAKAFRILRSLFITDCSVCVLVYDTAKSLDSRMSPRVHRRTSQPSIKGEISSMVGRGSPEDYMEESHFEQILTDFNNLGLHWSHSDSDMTLRGQRVILVATHSDKVPSSVSHNNFDQLRTAIKKSPYHKYVAMMKYVLSNSSVIERSNMEDLKRYIIEVTKKACRQNVPLKWLRCIRRFLALAEKGTYFITLDDTHRIISETCDISGKEERDSVVRFLHNNQIILHFSRVHQLCELVLTSPIWFARRLSALFGAAWIDASSGTMSRLQPDQNRLQMRGMLSAQLLDHLWKGETAAHRRRLLAILHKLDLIVCLGPNSQLISPSASPSSIAQETGITSSKGSPPLPPGVSKPLSSNQIFSVSSLVIPSVVAEPMPLYLLQMPNFDLQPLHFRFKCGFVPYDVFPRLLTRCIHSYPSNYTLYSNAGLFEVDPSTSLLVSESKGRITANLYMGSRSASASPQGVVPVNIDDEIRLPEAANLDTCMAVQMFLQAAISDITQQWLPQVEYDLCVECKCTKQHPVKGKGEEGGGGGRGGGGGGGGGESEVGVEEVHHVVLSQTDNILQRVSLNCERGTSIDIGLSLYSWFGEIPHPHSPEDDTTDYITTDDIEVVCVQLDAAWPVLGQALGFSRTELERIAMLSKTQVSAARKMMQEWKTLYKQNATFFALLGSLEIIQRRDIADDLVAARMCGIGIDL